MNLREAVTPKLNEELKEQKRREALQVLKQGLASIQPELRAAYLRLRLGPLTLPGLLKNYSPKELSKYITPIFTPPASPEEAKIKLLADLAISLLFLEEKNDSIIFEAEIEIQEAYNAIFQSGGGWSSPADKSKEKRKTAVLDWYRRNQARLSYLKEVYLEDTALYEDGGGQEKRNFITRLLIKIVKDNANQELTLRKVNARLKRFKTIRQPLRLEDV